jgi:hypothetical protein
VCGILSSTLALTDSSIKLASGGGYCCVSLPAVALEFLMWVTVAG